MKLILARHGKDDDRFRGGWSSLGLVPEGAEQARKLAEHLKAHSGEYGITRIVSSDLPRAMTTAAFVSAELGPAVEAEPRLREINNGDLAGMPNDIALERYPGLFFSALGADEHYPNGESPNEFFLRIEKWFTDFRRRCSVGEGNTLAVTHGGVINIILHLAKGMEWSNSRPPFPAAPCSLHVLNMDTMEPEAENVTDFLTT